MTPEEKAMNTAMCLHMSEFIAIFFAPFMSITGKRKLPDMRIRGNDCGSAQHGAIVKVSFLFRYLLQKIHRIHRIIIFQKLKIQVTAF